MGLRAWGHRSLSLGFLVEGIGPEVSVFDFMSIAVKVGLLSGRTADVHAGLDENVQTLKCRAQQALGVGKGRLVDSSGSMLDVCAPIKKARLQNGQSLTLHMNRVQVSASQSAGNPSLARGFCCLSWRWIRRYVGSCSIWW